MKFDEFFILLKSIFDKSEVDIEPSNDNFNLYLAMRYVSFYNPAFCQLMNETANTFKINAQFSTPVDGYKFLKSLLPKVPYKKIKYVKKQSSKNQIDKNISNEMLSKLANHLELSTREVRNLLNTNYE
jgi:hypothetical protein